MPMTLIASSRTGTGCSRMLAQGTPEALVQSHAVLPQYRLLVLHDAGERDGVLHESSGVTSLCAISAVSEEGQPAGRNSPRLLGHEVVGQT